MEAVLLIQGWIHFNVILKDFRVLSRPLLILLFLSFINRMKATKWIIIKNKLSFYSKKWLGDFVFKRSSSLYSVEKL